MLRAKTVMDGWAIRLRDFRIALLGTCLVMIGLSSVSLAQPPSAGEQPEETEESIRWNIPTKTLGGAQLWTDEFIHGDWRIQRHVWTGHYRLLNPRDVRQCWGTYDQCHEKFQSKLRRDEIPPLNKEVVLVLHGLGRSRHSMDSLCTYLKSQSDVTVLNMGYASTRASIDQHAESLGRVIDRLEGVEVVHFVAHSMGNLVIRRYSRMRLDDGPLGAKGPRFGRAVMLAPPNQGAVLAERFRNHPVFRTVMGTSGRQIAKDWAVTASKLAEPPCPFGIIAGGRSNREGYNPLIPGDDDLVVAVEETRLGGAADFIVVPSVHTTIMDQSAVHEYTLNFLQHGYFRSADQRQPIPSSEHEPESADHE